MIYPKKIINLISDTKGLKKHIEDYRLFKAYQVKLYNWFRFSPDEWLPRFIYERGILKNTKKKIAIFSVFGRRLNIGIDNSDFKIFFTGENVHSRFLEYDDLMLNNKNIDLSIGFDYLEHEKYIRFPIWLMNLFEPEEIHYKTIKEKCENWNIHNEINLRDKFCAFLSRHDYFGDRLYFFNEISKIGKVDSDGEFMHNNDDLKAKFNDNKFEYLNNYKFNLCPENSNYPGYCTEKVFEAIKCGCIPVYWGSDNIPEPEILNQDAIIFLNNYMQNDPSLIKIRQLKDNNKLYLDFVHQNRFTIQAPDVIYDFFVRLERALSDMINNH